MVRWKARPAVILKLATGLLGLVVTVWLALTGLSARHWVGYVPEKFGLGFRFAEGACVSNLFGYQGAFSYDLDEETIRAIEADGIGYFADVDRPRDPEHQILYEDWKETPAPASEISGEISNHFYCGWDHGWFWPAGFREALEAPGGFYSNGLTGRSVVVLPSLGIVAISMHSR